MDLDGDKRCDFHEFYTATVNYQKLFTPSHIESIFKTLDHNKNDYLEIEDFNRLLPTNLNKTGRVRYNKGPFFEVNAKVAKEGELEKIKERW